MQSTTTASFVPAPPLHRDAQMSCAQDIESRKMTAGGETAVTDRGGRPTAADPWAEYDAFRWELGHDPDPDHFQPGPDVAE